MYNYGLGRVGETDPPASGEEVIIDYSDVPPPSMELPVSAPVPDAPVSAGGAVEMLKGPIGLGVLGLVGGYLAGKGKRAKTRYAMVGGAVGLLAGFVMKRA